MNIFLNGVQVNEGGVESIDDVTIRLRRKDENNRAAKSFTTELTFHGIGWEIIRDELIEDPAGKFNQVDVLIYDDCCADENGDPVLLFEGIIRGDSIDWCEGDCYVRANVIEHTTETKNMDCIKSKLIYDNQNGFKQQQHPIVPYCTEIRPSGFQDVVMIVGIMMNIMFITMYPIVFIIWIVVEIINFIIDIINVIIDAINLIPGVDMDNIGEINIGGDADENIMQLWSGLIDDMNEWIIGCGRKHLTPRVRSYIQNVCNICGLSFQSSILNNPSSDYYETLYFNAPIKKGTRSNPVLWMTENDPIKTLEGLLSDLSPVFNADYRIEGNVLRFERKDVFWEGDPWLSYEETVNDGRLVEKVCYSWRDEDAPAFGTYQYMEDPVDFVGNEARKRWNNIVEFNQPVSELQKGAREIHLPFGCARVRGDGIHRDVLADYDWWPGWSGTINDYNNVMTMNNGMAINPKLIIWDGQDINFARIRRFWQQIGNVPPDETFNLAYWFHDEGVTPNTAYSSTSSIRSVYARFHTWNHPKVIFDRGLEFKFSQKFNCEILRNIDLYGVVDLPVGTGRANEIQLNMKSRIMTVIGHV